MIRSVQKKKKIKPVHLYLNILIIANILFHHLRDISPILFISYNEYIKLKKKKINY